MKSNKNSGSSVIIGSVIIVIVLLTGLGVWNYSSKKSSASDISVSGTTAPVTQPPPVTTGTTTTPVDVKNPPVKTSVYKDGTYSAVGEYNSPGGPESIGVSLTLLNDIVTDVTVTANAKIPQSRQYQSMFVAGIKVSVVGKSIDSLRLSRVSGASLTTNAFNSALAKIKVSAKA